MAGKVIVGCKLPNGIVIEHGNKAVTLNGANKDERLSGVLTVIINSELYGTTEVDEDFWTAWSKANKDFAPYKSGAIFVTKDKASARAAAKDVGKTGFEGMPQEDKKAGLKKAEQD